MTEEEISEQDIAGEAMKGEESEEALMEEWGRAAQEVQSANGGDNGRAASPVAPQGEGNGNYSAMEMESLNAGEDKGSASAPNLESILDIPITLSVEVGSTKMSIRHLLQLNQGSIVELERLVGEPLDVLVNGTLIAHGEVVVSDEKFGIRLTDVISARERVNKLK